MIVKDILGQEIKEGDYVVKSSGGNHSYVELYIYKVIKLNPSGSISLSGGYKTRADAPEKSCLKLTGNQIEAYLRNKD